MQTYDFLGLHKIAKNEKNSLSGTASKLPGWLAYKLLTLKDWECLSLEKY